MKIPQKRGRTSGVQYPFAFGRLDIAFLSALRASLDPCCLGTTDRMPDCLCVINKASSIVVMRPKCLKIVSEDDASSVRHSRWVPIRCLFPAVCDSSFNNVSQSAKQCLE